jgi:hypothetical protein
MVCRVVPAVITTAPIKAVVVSVSREVTTVILFTDLLVIAAGCPARVTVTSSLTDESKLLPVMVTVKQERP